MTLLDVLAAPTSVAQMTAIVWEIQLKNVKKKNLFTHLLER